MARIGIEVVAKHDDRAIFSLFEAKPDSFFRRDAPDERECRLVILRDVFVPLVLATQLELEVDTGTKTEVAQRISDDFLNRLFLKQPARYAAVQIRQLRLEHNTVASLIRR